MQEIRTTSLRSIPLAYAAPARGNKIGAFFKHLKITLNDSGRRALSFFSCGCYRYQPAKRYRPAGLTRSPSFVAHAPNAPVLPPGAAGWIPAVQAALDFEKPRPAVIEALEKHAVSALTRRMAPGTGIGLDGETELLEMDAVEWNASLGTLSEKMKSLFAPLREVATSMHADRRGGFFEWFFQVYSDLRDRIEAEDFASSRDRLEYAAEFDIVESEWEHVAKRAFEAGLDDAFHETFGALLLEATNIPASSERTRLLLKKMHAKSVDIFMEKRHGLVWKLLEKIPTATATDMIEVVAAREEQRFQGAAALDGVDRYNLFHLGRVQERISRGEFTELLTNMMLDDAAQAELLGKASPARMFDLTAREMLVMLPAEREKPPLDRALIANIDQPFS